MAEINVTPFVDVVLVLLIIFMVTAPLLAVGVPIDLPETRANPITESPEQTTISVDKDGVIYVNETAVPDGEVEQALATLGCGEGAQPQIVFRGDSAVPYGRSMAVLGELNRAGCNSISLVTDGSVNAP